MARVFGVFRLLALVFVLLPSAAAAQPRGAAPLDGSASQARPFSTSHALVIGIDDYQVWPKLRMAIPDAEAIGAALKSGGFQDVQIERNLDTASLKRAIEDFVYVKGADPDARLLIWFAGHGHTIGPEGYLVGRDAPDPGRTPASESAFQRVAMPLSDFGRYMNEVKARHVLAIFDSCFSGSVFNASRASAPASVAKATTQLARQFIASGNAGETALDDGTFRQTFIAALSGDKRALSPDGFLTGSRLGAFLADQISFKTKGAQNPIYSTSNVIGLDRGDFVFPASFPQLGAVVDVPIVSDFVKPGEGRNEEPSPEVRLELIEAFPPDDPYARNIADKLARNLVEYYVVNKAYISSALTGRAPERPPTHSIHAQVTLLGDVVSFDLDLVRADGAAVSTTSFEGPVKFYFENYKVLPPTIHYMFDISMRTFERLHSANRPTESGYAYALFLAARQRASRNQWEQAAELIQQAIDADDRFAAAYAAMGELALQRGEPQSVRDEWVARAEAIDKDFARLSVFGLQQMGDPVPALREAAATAPWTSIADGLEYRRIETADYKTAVLAWRYDQAKIGMSLVRSTTSRGETAAEMRNRKNALLAINAGFFDLDKESRLSPVGMIVVDGKELNPFDADKAKNPLTGILFAKDGRIGAMPARDYTPGSRFDAALQTGPLVVDPGGKNGIRSNGFDRQNRSVVCLTNDAEKPVIVQVSGGLSLYEVGQLLSTGEPDGGFGCERAINLDGGPSSQVSVLANGVSIEAPGLWKISSTLVLKPLAN